MNDDGKKEASSDEVGSTATATRLALSEDMVRVLRDANRAALNLMEDAVIARQRADELNEQLRHEIEQRKAVEAELRRRERENRETQEKLELLSESFHDYAIFTMDLEGNVVTWNPGAEKIFGFSEPEIIGQNARILFVPEDRSKGVPEKEMETARTMGRAADERWHIRKDNSRFYASGIMAPIHDGVSLIGYAKIARDLTKEKQIGEELRRQHEELESIVAGRTSELAEANEALRHQMDERRRIENERLALLQRIVTSQEDERRRIARDMHDSLGQQLTALRLKIASMKTDASRTAR